MFLTRVYLNPYRRGCRRLVLSPQRLHAAVLASFPPGVLDSAGEGRVLWRLDRPVTDLRSGSQASATLSQGPALSLYISSPVAPDPAGLVEQAGYETQGGVVVKNYDGFLHKLKAGQDWGFRITVNPVYRRAGQVNSRNRKKILGHITVDQQTRWFLDRVETHGSEILKSAQAGGDLPVLEDESGNRFDGENLVVSLVDRRLERFSRGSGKEKVQVTLQLATFQGILRVKNPAALCSALINGIGRAKGYGAGLMTLARP